jgi:two-component sensor histidine kinase
MEILIKLDLAEKALAKVNNELEQHVKQRTAALISANEVLETEVAERRLAEEQARASLAEKETLLREVHHRVKNNLQLISSLLHLQSRKVADNQVLAMYQESQNRIHSMALVHERLYQSTSLAQIDFAQYVHGLAIDLFHSYAIDPNRIRLKLDLEDTPLDIDMAIHCGLMVNELVSNALKHAFPRGGEGEVSLTLHSEGAGQHCLTVSDDGIGLPPGLEDADSDRLGLQLVVTIVEQIEGTLEIQRGKGTTFRICFAEATP